MNFNSVCRLCTETLEQNAMFPLFDGNGDLPAKIKLLTCVQMDAGDGLPSQACEKCLSLLNSFVEFKTLVENSDVSLRRCLRIQDDEIECLQLFVKEENTTNEGTFILSTTIENNEEENDDDDIQEMEDPLLIKEVEGVQNGAINNNCETEVEKYTRVDKKQPHPVLKCDFCTRKFSMFQGFMVHMKKHPKMECKICNKIFSTWQTFNNHRQTHADSSGLECPICNKRIKNERGLKRHYRLYHISEISVECDVCKRTFFSEKSLKLHSAIHSEDRRHICTVCNEEFSTGFGLRSHSSTHAMDSSNRANPEANPYECEFCKRRFLLFRSLRCHQRYCKSIQDLEVSSPMYNQQETPVMSRSGYECPFCEKTFEELLSFKFHVKTHNRISKKCTICSKSFKTIKGLIIHQKVHESLNTKEIPVDQTFIEDASINSSELSDISDEDSSTTIDNFSTLMNECKKCKKYFKTERALKIHVTKIHRMQSELHINSPDIQNGESSLTENLSTQKTIHNQLPESSFNQNDQQQLTGMENEKTSKVMCTQCNRDFKNADGLKKHIGKMHKYFQHESYASSSELQSDSTGLYDQNDQQLLTGVANKKRGRVMCTQCNRDFKNEDDLKKHIDKMHKYFQHESCASSSELQNDSTGLSDQNDQQLLTGVANKKRGRVMCTQCNRDFKNEDDLKKHIGKMHKYFQHKSYASSSKLQNQFTGLSDQNDVQLLTGVANKKRGKVMCTQCSGYFKNEDGLKKHIGKMHKYFQHKSYPSSSELQNGSTESDCNECSLHFKNIRGLKRHNAKVHKQSQDRDDVLYSVNQNQLHNFPVEIENEKEFPKIVHYENFGQIECIDCNLYFKNARALSTHRSHRHKQSSNITPVSRSELYETENCVQFPTEVNIQNTQQVECIECHLYFKNARALTTHRSHRHKQSSNITPVSRSELYETENCVQFPTEVNIQNTEQVECIECHLYFKNARALTTHRSHRHKQSSNITPVSRSELYETENCVQFPTEVNIQNTEQVECIECHLYFKNARALGVHRSHRHKQSSIITPVSRSELYETENCIQFPAEVNSQNTEQVECIECHLYFKNARALGVHRSHRHKQSSIITPVSRSELYETENCIQFPAEVNSQNTEQVECIECHLYFKNARALGVHRSHRHKQSSIITPVSRSELYETENCIQFPAEVNRQNIEQVECIECHLYFKNARALRTHRSHRHKQSSIITPVSRSELYETENCIQFPAEVNHQNTEQVQCIECHLYFKNARALSTHRSHRHKQSSNITPVSRSELYETENCVQFPTEVNIQNTEQVECIECHLYFKNARALSTHRSHRHKQSSNITPVSRSELYETENCVQFPTEVNHQNTEQVECIECHLYFKNARALTTHRSHRHKQSSNITPVSRSELYETENCVQFPTEVNIQNTEQVECIECHLYFKNARALRTHRSHRHKQSSIITPVSCSELYETENCIQYPAEVNRQNIEQVECIECHLYFKNARALKAHRSHRHKNSSITTSVTSSEMRSDFAEIQNETCLSENIFTKNAAEFECQECKLCFKNKRALTTHSVKLHRKLKNSLYRKSRQIECPECKLYFKNTQGLRTHTSKMHKQSDITTIDSYSEVQNDTSEIQNHSSENQQNEVECPLCKLNFKSDRALRAHSSQMHGQSPTSVSTAGRNVPSDGMKHIQQNSQKADSSIINDINSKASMLDISTNSYVDEYYCAECEKNFETEFGLNVHNGMRHRGMQFVGDGKKAKSLLYNCQLCDKRFTAAGMLIHHAKVHQQENEASSSKIPVNKYLQRQNETSSSQVPVNEYQQSQNDYKCKLCNLKTESLKSFRFHMSIKKHVVPENLAQLPDSSSKDIYECSICSKFYFSQLGFDIHQEKFHKNKVFLEQNHSASSVDNSNNSAEFELVGSINRSLCCSQCNRSFNTSRDLTHHYAVEHKNIETLEKSSHSVVCDSDSVFKCCNKLFDSQKDLEIHQRHCHENDTRSSSVVNAAASSNIKIHMETVEKSTTQNLDQIPADSSTIIAENNTSFTSENGLNMHCAETHIEKSNGIVEIHQNCGTSDASPVFIQIDDEEELHSCSFCNKTFNSEYELNVHCAKIHASAISVNVKDNVSNTPLVNSYHCSTCNKTFDCKRSLNFHNAEVHLENVSESSDRNSLCEISSDSSSDIIEINEINSCICALCNESYCNEQELKLHQSKMHSKERCDIIESGNSSDYVSHALDEHGEGTSVHHKRKFHQEMQSSESDKRAKKVLDEDNTLLNFYRCSLCNLRFFNEMNLKIHSSKCHGDELLQEVNNCRNIYVPSNSDQSNEMSSVTCSYCDREFMSEDALVLHFSKTHMESDV